VHVPRDFRVDGFEEGGDGSAKVGEESAAALIEKRLRSESIPPLWVIGAVTELTSEVVHEGSLILNIAPVVPRRSSEAKRMPRGAFGEHSIEEGRKRTVVMAEKLTAAMIDQGARCERVPPLTLHPQLLAELVHKGALVLKRCPEVARRAGELERLPGMVGVDGLEEARETLAMAMQELTAAMRDELRVTHPIPPLTLAL